MFKVIFLIVLAVIWMVVAIVQDLKRREVANWISFSLIIFALGFRFFWSLFYGVDLGEGFSFFYQGLIGFGIFFLVGNFFYYSRIFAGGDAKLMISLGAILPFYNTFSDNVFVFITFVFAFLISGAVYGLLSSFFLAFNHRKEFNKEFRKQFNKKKKILYILFAFGILIFTLGFYLNILFVIGIFIFFIPYLYLFAKSVDEACMIKLVSADKLTVGDWLYSDVRIGKNLIKKDWNGLDEKEINMIKKSNKSVLIRTGIPYTPVFLVAFIILVYVLFN